LAQATGKAPADADDVATSALVKLAEKLGAPAKVQQQIKDLTTAASAARDEQAKAVKATADAAAEIAKARKEHESRLTKELAAHEQNLADGHAKLETAKKQAANLLAAAKADAEAAAKLKVTWQRKMAAFESTA
jgi:chromosome segregation ATPase